MNSEEKHNKEENFKNTWRNFVNPWEKVSILGNKVLDNKKRNPKVVKEVIHVVAEEIRSKELQIPAKYLKNIAQEMCKKFPGTFEDRDDDGVLIGEGYHGVFFKLQDRIKYLNRTSNKRIGDFDKIDIPLSKKKQMLSSKAGCSFWDPPVPSNDSHLNSLETAQQLLQTKTCEVEFSADTLKLLDLTYSAQRRYLNQEDPPSIVNIMKHWPILLCQSGIYWHFNKLMDKDINELSKAMIKKAENIIQLGVEKKYITDIPEAEDAKLICVLQVISKFFTESLNLLYAQIPEVSL